MSLINHYFTPIDASAAKMVWGFTKAFEATGDPLHLAKARSLADSIARVQVPAGPNAGLYLTAWATIYRDEWHKPFDYYWVNCLMYDVKALLDLDAVLEHGIAPRRTDRRPLAPPLPHHG